MNDCTYEEINFTNLEDDSDDDEKLNNIGSSDTTEHSNKTEDSNERSSPIHSCPKYNFS